MPARRRAPQGCRLGHFLFPILSFTKVPRHGGRQQNVKLSLREPLEGSGTLAPARLKPYLYAQI